MIRSTHTLAELELSPAAYEEIANKLLDARYDHAFLGEGGMIDMSGIAITRKKPDPNMGPRVCITCHKPEGEPHPYRHPARYEEVV
jgi:hypothetical protein